MPGDTALIREAASSGADAAPHGLLKTPKTLPARLFYDELGCRLFEQITELPEYYLTRTERGLLELAAPRVAAMFSTPFALVEYGASDEAKAEFLLQVRSANGQPAVQAYVPIDVATPGLARMIERLRQSRAYLQ